MRVLFTKSDVEADEIASFALAGGSLLVNGQQDAVGLDNGLHKTTVLSEFVE